MLMVVVGVVTAVVVFVEEIDVVSVVVLVEVGVVVVLVVGVVVVVVVADVVPVVVTVVTELETTRTRDGGRCEQLTNTLLTNKELLFCLNLDLNLPVQKGTFEVV